MIEIKNFYGTVILVVEKDTLSDANLFGADLSSADLSGADLSGANLDYSCLSFSCKSLKGKFTEKHLIQILYHAAMPTQNNKLELSDSLRALFNSADFKNIVNRFHRQVECGFFEGPQ